MKKILKIMIILVSILVLGYFSIYLYCYLTPKINVNKSKSYYLYDHTDMPVFEENDWISLEKISPYLIDATIVTEDKSFYKHLGFDYFRIIKAMFTNVVNRENIQGASTISQQYARNLFLNFDKTWKRKIDEALMAIELEVHYSKDEILEGYLNTINYGGVMGIENASYYYFNKSASELSLPEAALVAGIPKAPTNYSPYINYENAIKRQQYILKTMYKNKLITEKQYNDAIKTELVFEKKENDTVLTSLLYYQDAVLDELNNLKVIPKSLIDTGGIKIYTELDKLSQESLENAINKNVTDNDEIETAGVMINPSDGAVLGLVGGMDYYRSQFNRVTQAKRHIGSTIKPFLYYAALENGFTESSSFTSSLTTFSFSNNQTYTPRNYNNKYPNAPISMATAVAYSDNIYAVKTHLFLGEEVLVDMLKRVGVTNNAMPVPSLALGSIEVRLLDLVGGYASFANEGYRVVPHFIRKIEDNQGNVLYERTEENPLILNRSLTYIMNEILTTTYDSSFIDYNYPTVINIFPQFSRKYSVKTGTTDTDILIVGYNRDAIVGIWNGYDDSRNLVEDDKKYYRQIWVDAMEGYLKDKKSTWYEMPENVVGILVNPITGEVVDENNSQKKIFYFIKGTEPYYTNTHLDTVFGYE